MYRIEVDEQRGRIALTLEGFWSIETLRAFASELMPAVARVRAAHPHFTILSDSRGFAVQSSEVSEAFDRMMNAGAQQSGGRTAIVVASALNRMQATRVFTSPSIRVFTDMAAAQIWLDGGDEDSLRA